MSNELYDNFRLYFPPIEKHVVDWHEHSPYELFVRLDDGEAMLYNDMDHLIRRLPKDSNRISEVECRTEFGYRLYEAIRRNGMTQYELAEKIGIDQATLSRYMRGKNTPSFYIVDKIAKALKISIDELRYID